MTQQQTPTFLGISKKDLVELFVILAGIGIMLGIVLYLIGEIIRILGSVLGPMGMGSALTLVAVYLYMKYRGTP
jgi:hypothetical protein